MASVLQVATIKDQGGNANAIEIANSSANVTINNLAAGTIGSAVTHGNIDLQKVKIGTGTFAEGTSSGTNQNICRSVLKRLLLVQVIDCVTMWY